MPDVAAELVSERSALGPRLRQVHLQVGLTKALAGAVPQRGDAVRADAEICSVAVEARFETGLERVFARRVGHSLADVEQVPIRLHHGSGRRIERFVETIAKLHRGIGVIRGGKSGCGSFHAQQRFKSQSRRSVQIRVRTLASPYVERPNVSMLGSRKICCALLSKRSITRCNMHRQEQFGSTWSLVRKTFNSELETMVADL